ncbi:MAG: DUF3276 family protein [Candidatus Amulumruptor caecigallinarius]|nr:DUF3276 family protein [Candidatus Amulumruptor caecigallinarius]MCM1397425.1 DUF3276 family protein [Candidatus Amulumruptor caecigallinarius]MCM1454368.1 DUF3276 family protein [bacterium]
MEKAKPIYSKRISAGTRVYYLDVLKDKNGKSYISISEIPTSRSPQKKRQRIFVYQENLEAFKEALGDISDRICQ